MTEALHLIPASAETEWQRWLGLAPHDFYHTAKYHQFSEQAGEGQAWLAVYGSAERYLAWPYLLRQIPGSCLRDITSVYGYSGPLSVGPPSDDCFFAKARWRLAELWRSQNAVSVFSRFHPLLENHCRLEGPLDSATYGGIKPSGTTVSIDLTVSDAANWREYQPSLRNRINRARRLGLVTSADPAWSHLDQFVLFYRATMVRNRALPFYFFPAEYFSRLRAAMAPYAWLMLTRLGDRIAAAGIFIEYAGIVQNHFCVNNPDCLHLAPSKVLLDDVRRWARQRGNRVFHLGGGRGGNCDSLFAFKAAFSRTRHGFYTGRWVLDRDAYYRLCRRQPLPPADFFPAYRAAAIAEEGVAFP